MTPEDRIGILCAGDDEAAPFISALENRRVSSKAMLNFHEGRLENIDTVVLFSGVCKVNAAIAAQILIDTYGCRAIINAGTAGGMDPQTRCFDTIVATESAYWDISEDILTEFHPWLDTVFFQTDSRLIALARKVSENMPEGVRFGRIVTWEAFVGDEIRETINARFRPAAVDMETASIAHVCHVNRIPFIAVRTVTDAADCEGPEAFEKNCAAAANKSALFVKKMLREISK